MNHSRFIRELREWVWAALCTDRMTSDSLQVPNSYRTLFIVAENESITLLLLREWWIQRIVQVNNTVFNHLENTELTLVFEINLLLLHSMIGEMLTSSTPGKPCIRFRSREHFSTPIPDTMELNCCRGISQPKREKLCQEVSIFNLCRVW